MEPDASLNLNYDELNSIEWLGGNAPLFFFSYNRHNVETSL